MKFISFRHEFSILVIATQQLNWILLLLESMLSEQVEETKSFGVLLSIDDGEMTGQVCSRVRVLIFGVQTLL